MEATKGIHASGRVGNPAGNWLVLFDLVSLLVRTVGLTLAGESHARPGRGDFVG